MNATKQQNQSKIKLEERGKEEQAESERDGEVKEEEKNSMGRIATKNIHTHRAAGRSERREKKRVPLQTQSQLLIFNPQIRSRPSDALPHFNRLFLSFKG